MKKIACLCFVIFLSQIAFPQLAKKNWLVGGNASFTANRYKSSDIQETFVIDVMPNIGYFILDKFAVGLKPGYSYIKGKNSFGTGGVEHIYKIGPFLRYYLLTAEKPFNVLIETDYQYGLTKTNAATLNKHSFSFFGGPAIFFNSSVGIEFLLGYSTSSFKESTATESFVRMAVGLQVHLQK